MFFNLVRACVSTLQRYRGRHTKGARKSGAYSAISKYLSKVYTQNELKAQNIITMDYVLNLEPGEYVAVLDLKAQARNCLRVFFTFEDGRKIMAAAQWWQRYLGFYEIPVGTHLLLHYRENSRKEVYLDEVERI